MTSPSAFRIPLIFLLLLFSSTILSTDGDDDVSSPPPALLPDDHPDPEASPAVTPADSSSTAPSSAVLYSLSKSFRLMCCMGGTPELVRPDLVRNFSLHSASLVMDGDFAASAAQNCRLFDGSFVLPRAPGPLGVQLELSYASQVACKCPEMGMGRVLDRHCRRVPACEHNGIHSLMDPRRCFCLDPFFGDRCEKVCDQGRRIKGVDGRDRCSCVPFYRGEECRDPICLNGGRPTTTGPRGGPDPDYPCHCPPQFVGFHCEIDPNRNATSTRTHHPHEFGATIGASSASSRFHRFGGGGDQGGNEMFSRDVSGTVFSLVMIVVLVLSMYLLMKHRMQVQSRYLSSRRADLLGACQFPGHHFPPPGSARRVELLPVGGGGVGGDLHAAPRAFPASFARSLAPFLSAAAAAAAADNTGGPPPYAPPGQRARRSRGDVLPPLPSYEDATKLPALIPAAAPAAEGAIAEEAEEAAAEETRMRRMEEAGGRGGRDEEEEMRETEEGGREEAEEDSGQAEENGREPEEEERR